MSKWLSDAENENKIEKYYAIDSVIIARRGFLLNGFQRVNVSLTQFQSKELSHVLLRARCELPSPEDLESSRLVKGKFDEHPTSMLLWNFKKWLTGTHHHCSIAHLNGYLDEFFFRYNWRHRPGLMLQKIIQISMEEYGQEAKRDYSI